MKDELKITLFIFVIATIFFSVLAVLSILDPSTNGLKRTFFIIPTLCFTFMAVVTGILLSREHEKSRREKSGLCLDCGYDLRASDDICPECGMPTNHPIQY